MLLSLTAGARFEYGNFKERSLKNIPEPLLHAPDNATRPDSPLKSIAYVPADQEAYKKWQRAETGKKKMQNGGYMMLGGVLFGGVAVAMVADANSKDKAITLTPIGLALLGVASIVVGLITFLIGSSIRAMYHNYREKPPGL